MPQTTPPISWLCEALGLMIVPQAVTSRARVTRTVPRSGSTFTSTNYAPYASVAYFPRSSEGRASNISVSSVRPLRCMTSETRTTRDGSLLSRSQPSSILTSGAAAPCSFHRQRRDDDGRRLRRPGGCAAAVRRADEDLAAGAPPRFLQATPQPGGHQPGMPQRPTGMKERCCHAYALQQEVCTHHT